MMKTAYLLAFTAGVPHRPVKFAVRILPGGQILPGEEVQS